MGNKMHWILAGILGAGVAVIIIVLVFFPFPSGPTSATLGPDKLTQLGPTQDVALILPAEPAGDGDAGDDYARAIGLHKQNRDAITKICTRQQEIVKGQYRLTAADLKLLNPIEEAIAAAAAKTKMTYSFRHTPAKIEIPYEAAEAKDFQDLADVPIILAYAHVGSGQEAYPKAEKCLLDLLTMGRHMVSERARMDTVLYGIGLQKSACELLCQLYATKWNKPDLAKQVRRYANGLEHMSLVYGDHYNRVIWHLPPHPGDAFNLAENHADRAVRVEATLALGVVKLTCEGRGDRRYVRKLIAKRLNSPDPIEREAARCADALDQAGLRRLIEGK